jgi:hypothetical protein
MPAAEFPPLDFSLAPRTGWARLHWQAVLARLTAGLARAVARSGSPARALYPDDRRGLPDAVDGLESFARLASAWGAWLSNPANPDCLFWNGQSFDVAALLHQGLLDGTDPRNPYTYWGDIGHMDQRIVESADLSVALWLSRDRVLSTMSPAEQAQVIAWLAQVDGKGTYPDNWILFSAMTQAVRLQLGFGAPETELDSRLDQVAEFYQGDGWYVDGLADEYELYNAWMFNWHYLLWALIDGDRRPDYRQRVLDRSRSFVAGFLHFFGANGAYPAWGRSIVYRFAAVAAFQTAHRLGCAPAAPGLLRRVSSGCLRYFYDRGAFDPHADHLYQGFHGNFPAANEPYISPGSVYWCAHGLFALGFDTNDPFWSEPEAPLPVEQGDFEVVLPAPGFVLAGRQATGQVLLLNSRSGQEHDSPGYHYAAKYGKFAYSTHFPFNVLAVAGSAAPDAMLALTRDGRRFGHRLRTRAGGVAPGFIWCRFDEMVDDELQPIWAAVLLWGDRQIRLALVRPTYPVQAYEAPGALGCESPTAVCRRSDPAAGWEYAQAEGRALAIRRLLGYDAQLASAPFLDHANLNLAYPYAEQPLVFEREPSVAPRCLASLCLVRPAPFDPAQDLSGVQAQATTAGHFQVSLPQAEQAFVALGEALPRSISIGGLSVEGRGLRYARLTANSLCGLGLTHVAGRAAFASPATARLASLGDGRFEVATDAGLELDPAWLGGPIRRAAVRGLDGSPLDATSDCGAYALPATLVEHWSVHLERRLVIFELHT